MVGAIVGDVIGSSYEFNNCLNKQFKLFTAKTCFTDDTVMTCAVAKALIDGKEEFGSYLDIPSEYYVKKLREVGSRYPSCGYGRRFFDWVLEKEPQPPYNSCGNGSAMRISPVGFVANSEEECIKLAENITKISHNHEEGIKGAVCTALCVYWARNGKSKEFIKQEIVNRFGYDLEMTCDEIRQSNIDNGTTSFHKEICQISVPQALICFLESENFEDCIRNCVSTGGDSDTVGAIAGGIAEAYYGVPFDLAIYSLSYLDSYLLNIVGESITA